MCIFSILSLHISKGSEKENLFNNQELLLVDHFPYSHDLNV